MSKETPATQSANTPQRVLKSLQPEQNVLTIITSLTGGEMENILQCVASFTKCFECKDKYIVAIKVERVLQETEQT